MMNTSRFFVKAQKRVISLGWIGLPNFQTSRDAWEQQRDRSDAELQGHRQAMRDCCEEIEVLYELEMTDDWLQGEVYGGHS